MTGSADHRTEQDREVARNKRLARNIAAGSDVAMPLEEVITSATQMARANLDVPGPRVLQIIDELHRVQDERRLLLLVVEQLRAEQRRP